MRRARQNPALLIRCLLAGWLILLPWFTVAATQPSIADNDRQDTIEMPCHAHAADQTAESPALDCPHCAGDSLAPCKCCSFATSAAIPAANVSAHLRCADNERHPAVAIGSPPATHHEQLYRPPIHRFV
jgi:hypothetical protein